MLMKLKLSMELSMRLKLLKPLLKFKKVKVLMEVGVIDESVMMLMKARRG